MSQEVVFIIPHQNTHLISANTLNWPPFEFSSLCVREKGILERSFSPKEELRNSLNILATLNDQI